LFGNGSGEGYAASDLLCCWHGIIIHQFGASVTRFVTTPRLAPKGRARTWGTRRVGKGNPPVERDELPPEFAAKKKKNK